SPFALGVASGPAPGGGVGLWTRLALGVRADIEALSGLTLRQYVAARQALSAHAPDSPRQVLWELAPEPTFRHGVIKGLAQARPELGYSVHVQLPGDALRPGREYWYRFTLGDAISDIGRTLTLPAAHESTAPFRMALASCQHYEHGYFGAYAAMRDDDPQAVLFVGDYIYEGGPSRGRFRAHPFPSARTLFDYRLRHALYKLDPDLQRMHAHCPWWVTWDDHEVSNDYAGDLGQSAHVDGAARRLAAYQAYYEHMPLPASMLAASFDQLRIYRRLSIGRLAEVMLLDNRQYRHVQACSPPGRAGGRHVDDLRCPQRLEPQRSLLGQAQMAWLSQGFARSSARWNLIAQQTLFSALLRPQATAHARYWTDGWDGYPAERERILAAIEASRLRGAVMLGGDVHANWVCNLKRDDARADSRTLGAEFCGTSITSPSHWPAAKLRQTVAFNEHVRFANTSERGYALLDLGAQQLDVRLRVVGDVRERQPQARTLARFRVDPEVPGVQT
ncbi:MAG TPA: alkaline phosphatase D family protein, partial [Burkholderiaceae bacterium]|nr:alkaline phosphatase D family protein [Burkholderiaceae bacterium]